MKNIAICLLIIVLIFAGCTKSAVQENDEGKISINDFDIDHLSINTDAKKILKYLIALSNNTINGVIIGQNCGHGSQIADKKDLLMGYDSLVENLHNETGKYVGILGVDYEHDKIFTPEELSECNKVLIDYWNKGGLITINWSPQNPWLNDESDLGKDSGNWMNTRNMKDNLDDVSLYEIVNPDAPIRKVWLNKLDRIADALLELKKAGIVVLWRPMQEMNGNWFWWGFEKNRTDPMPYINIYRDMYDYFTNVKGLDNLIWVYSPAGGGQRTWGWAYPGDEYVHVVATTVYSDNLYINHYDEMVAVKRPIILAEYGGSSIQTTEDKGLFDNRNYLDNLISVFPKVSAFVCWHNWLASDEPDNTLYIYHSLNRNKHYKEVMNDRRAITMDELEWRQFQE
jgi:mannan endo-1,4-beta-mannosidase